MDVDLNSLKVPDLKRELKSLGLSTAGTKSDLIARLQLAMSADKPQSDDSVLDDELLDDDEDEMLEGEDDLDLDSTVGGVGGLGSNITSREVTSTTNVSSSSPTKIAPASSASAGSGVTTSAAVSTSTSPVKRPSPLAQQNGAQASESVSASPKKKKLILNRDPVEPPTSTDTPSAAGEEQNKSTKVSVTAPQSAASPSKSAENAKGLSEPERLKLRQQKFGKGVGADTPAAAVSSSPATATSAIVDEKLKKRAEKFTQPNLTASTTKISLVTEDDIKIAKRKERFGIADPITTSVNKGKTSIVTNKLSSNTVTASAPPSTKTTITAGLEEGKLKRAARFALGTSTAELEEKKKVRAARFNS